MTCKQWYSIHGDDRPHASMYFGMTHLFLYSQQSKFCPVCPFVPTSRLLLDSIFMFYFAVVADKSTAKCAYGDAAWHARVDLSWRVRAWQPHVVQQPRRGELVLFVVVANIWRRNPCKQLPWAMLWATRRIASASTREREMLSSRKRYCRDDPCCSKM